MSKRFTKSPKDSLCLTQTLKILQRSLVELLQLVLFWVALLVSLTYCFLSWSDESLYQMASYVFNKTDNVEEQSARASSQWKKMAVPDVKVSSCLKVATQLPPVKMLSSALLSDLVCFHHSVSQFVQLMYWEKRTTQDKPVQRRHKQRSESEWF